MDVSDLVTGHLGYREKLGDILHRVCAVLS
jgi:hypothetical protein